MSFVQYGRQVVSWAVALALTSVVSGCSFGQISATPAPSGPFQVVHVKALDFRWIISPNHLKSGETVKFVVDSVQGVHGFSIVGTNISNSVSQGSAPSIVYWKTPIKGTYTVACNVYCGAGHPTMVTTLKVV